MWHYVIVRSERPTREIPYVSLIAATRQRQPSDIVKYSLLSKSGYDLGIKDIIPQPL